MHIEGPDLTPREAQTIAAILNVAIEALAGPVRVAKAAMGKELSDVEFSELRADAIKLVMKQFPDLKLVEQ